MCILSDFVRLVFSLFFESSLNGGTVIRPVFFEFPDDTQTHDISYQFMWGPAMMIVPVYQAVIFISSSILQKLLSALQYTPNRNQYLVTSPR